MKFPIAFASLIVIVLGGACKTVPLEQPQKAALPAAAAAQDEDPAPVVKPSATLKSSPDLVTPGPDEVLNKRGPGARCPTSVELDTLENTVTSLGRETMNLVREDLNNLRQTSTRSDRDSVASCCNQMEQLVQDAEIMNEDRDAAVSALERIRKLTLSLCPPS